MLLAPMVIWKLFTTGFVIHFNLWTDTAARALEEGGARSTSHATSSAAVGLSFSTFRGIDLVMKTYLGAFVGLRPDEVFFYGFFPPVQLIGPASNTRKFARR